MVDITVEVNVLFPTIEFAIFFAIVFPISWSLRHKIWFRKLFLLVASYVFYAFWDYRFVLLLAETSIVNFLLGKTIERTPEGRKRNIIFWLGIAFNLAVLGFFKYWGFFLGNLAAILQTAGLERELPLWEIILPMGISFFTFQGISYIVDIYRKDIKATDSIIDVLLYISFFPQLVAGPIIRAKEFLPTLKIRQGDAGIPFTRSVLLIASGLFKKIVIAHYLAILLVDPVFTSPEDHATLDLILATYGYAFQIYCDFSAYSDIAIGLAALLGFHFAANFRQPYRSKSITEFWRRWHISLSSWLRDYLYIPLGGNRLGRFKTYRNLMITMLLGGLWHGAAWTFVIWGALHGAALAANKLLQEKKLSLRIPSYEKIILTFHFVCFSWIFFKAASLAEAITFLESMGNISQSSVMFTAPIITLLALGFTGQLVPENTVDYVAERLDSMPTMVVGALAGILVAIIGAIGPGTLAPFIYFQF